METNPSPSRTPITPPARCETHPGTEGVEVRLRGVRGFRIVACAECRARMEAAGHVTIPVA